MRRAPAIAAACLACSALAGTAALAAGPSWLTGDKPVMTLTPDEENGAAVAIDPTGTAAIVAANHWQVVEHTATSATADWSAPAWPSSETTLPGFSGYQPVGDVDAAWAATSPTTALVASAWKPAGQCNAIGLNASTDAGASWSAAYTNTNLSSDSQPRVSVGAPGSPSPGRAYVAFTQQSGCPTGSRSDVYVAYADPPYASLVKKWLTPGGGSAPRYDHPAVAALPGGGAVVVFRDALAHQILSVTCSASLSCNAPTAVAADAADPGTVDGMSEPAAPAVVAAGPRVVVAWPQAAAGGGSEVWSATSWDGGASWSAPARASDASGPSNAVEPALAATQAGRVDLAFLDDRNGLLQVFASSSNVPLEGTGEAWSQNVAIQQTGADPAAGDLAASPTLGGRIGVAVAEHGFAAGAAPATVAAWTDTRQVHSNSDQDVFEGALLHGTTTPALPDQSAEVGRNITQAIPLPATDADGDPLTYALVAGAHAGGATASIPDPNRPSATYAAGPASGSDSFTVRVSDAAVPPHTVDATLHVNVVNMPPVFNCGELTTQRNRAVTIPNCVSDPNGDTVALTAEGVRDGSIPSGPVLEGTTKFTPSHDWVGTTSFTLVADDGHKGIVSEPITVHVTAGSPAVSIANQAVRAVAGRRLTLRATAVDAPSAHPTLLWSWGDHSGTSRGTSASHVYVRAGSYRISVWIKGANGSTQTRRIRVHAPSLDVVGLEWSGRSLALRVRTTTRGALTVSLGGATRTVQVAPGMHLLALPSGGGGRRTGRLAWLDVRLRGKARAYGPTRLTRALVVPPT
jgi:hypothetical protein